MSLLLIFPKPWCCRTKPKGHLVQRQQFCVLRKCDSGCPKGCREQQAQGMEWGSGAWPWTPDPALLECWVLLALLRAVLAVPLLGAGAGLGSPSCPRGLVVQSQVPPTKCPLFGSSCYSLSPMNPFAVP